MSDADQQALCAEMKRQIDEMFADSRIGPPRGWYEALGGRRYVYSVIANGAVRQEGRRALTMGIGFEAKAVKAILSEVARQFPHHAHQRVVWRRLPTYTTSSSTERENEETFALEDDHPDHDLFCLSVRLCAEEMYDVEAEEAAPIAAQA